MDEDGAKRLCEEEEDVYMLGEAVEDSNKPAKTPTPLLVTFGASCKISGGVFGDSDCLIVETGENLILTDCVSTGDEGRGLAAVEGSGSGTGFFRVKTSGFCFLL
jgi:hypothetical protein